MFCINFQPTQKLHWCKVSHWYSWYLYFSKKLLFRFQPKEIVASHLDLRLTKYISPCEILCTSICVLLGAKCGFIVDCSKYFCFDVIKQLIIVWSTQFYLVIYSTHRGQITSPSRILPIWKNILDEIGKSLFVLIFFMRLCFLKFALRLLFLLTFNNHHKHAVT